MFPETFSVGSLSDEDLKEFQSPTLEDTASLEKEEKATTKEEKVEKEEKVVENKKTVGSLEEEFITEKENTPDEVEEEIVSTDTKEKKPAKSSKEEIALDFNAVYQKYVKKGTWVPVTDENGNEVEVNDEETFIKLMDWQTQNAADNALKERESEFGDQYQTLVTHLKNGGKVEDLASNYQQEREYDSYDLDNTEDAESVIKAHCEAMEWSAKRTKSYIDSLKDQGDEAFKEVAEESKAALVKAVKEEREQIVAEQEVQAKRIADYQKAYNTKLRESIHSQEIPEREKKDLEKFYYDLKNPVQGGKASDFYLKFEEIKQDPAKWMKLVQVVKDFENFEKKSTTEKEVKTKLFKLVREGESLSKKDSQTPEAVKTDRKQAPTTFKRLYNQV